MTRRKKKLTAEQKAEKRRRREKYEWIFVNGKQKRVEREQTIDGMSVDEFIRNNADPIWLHQNGLWEYMEPEDEIGSGRSLDDAPGESEDDFGDIPF